MLNKTCEPPKPSVNIHYDSGVDGRKDTTGLLTIHSDLGSLWYMIFVLVTKGVPQLLSISASTVMKRIKGIFVGQVNKED
jgi:hypothetical protein